MPGKKLTELAIKSLKPKDKPYTVSDGTIGGLFVAVATSGKKVFRLGFKFQGKVRQLTLCSYPEFSRADDQYVNLRPIILHEGVSSPVTTCTPTTVNMVVVRENTEGEYSQLGGMFSPDAPHGFATQMAVFSRVGCERVIRYAFELARERKAAGGKGKVTNCTKSNALNYSMVYWDRIFKEVAAKYPDIETNYYLVDALSMLMLTDPGQFDVIVASNLFGDIITDLGSVLQGGIGVAAGGNIDPERRGPSMFEPIHGSALALAGQGKVNPIASIESGRMMLDFLGEKKAAEALLKAVKKVLAEGKVRTGDMGGTSSTSQVGDAVKAALAG